MNFLTAFQKKVVMEKCNFILGMYVQLTTVRSFLYITRGRYATFLDTRRLYGDFLSIVDMQEYMLVHVMCQELCQV